MLSFGFVFALVACRAFGGGRVAVGVIAAMEEEVTILQGGMENVKVEQDSACPAFVFYTGKLEGKDVVLLQSGIGKVQAAAGCAVMLEKYKPTLVINTGSAGGINPPGQIPLKIGDVVISNALAYHDFDVRGLGYKLGQVPGWDSPFFAADPKLIKLCEDSVRELESEKLLPENFQAVPGLICSGDVFVSDPQKVLDLLQYFPDMRAVEMEGAAIAHVCTMFNTPFLVVRCVSDLANEEAPVNFTEFLPLAAKNSSEIVRELVSKL